MKPFIKLGHKNGRVFLRLVRMGRLGRESTVVALDPEEAKQIGEELITLAARAQGRGKRLKTNVIKPWPLPIDADVEEGE